MKLEKSWQQNLFRGANPSEIEAEGQDVVAQLGKNQPVSSCKRNRFRLRLLD